jgi:hypothetical protein
MSEDDKPTKPAKEKVKDEDRGDAAAQEQQRILRQAKE